MTYLSALADHQKRIRAKVAAAQEILTKQFAVPCSDESHGRDRPDVVWLTPREVQSAADVIGADKLAAMKPSTSELMKGAESRSAIGRGTCGHYWLLTVESVQKDINRRADLEKARTPWE